MSEVLLSVEELYTGYGDVKVLWGVDLDVRKGEIVCLVGSNGAGKSTLLRCISGLLPVTGGRITFAGRELPAEQPSEVVSLGIAHVPEGRRLFSAMSVRDNLLMGAYARRDGTAAIQRDLDYVCTMFPRLAERLKQNGGTLSGGEQQMCAIARGIMSRPELLLIDELSLGLAPVAVEALSEALLRINAETDISILLVEQDVVAAFELAQRGFVMDLGRITLCGAASDLAANPTVREAYMGIAEAPGTDT